MTILYNCKHAGDQYQITKFDDDGNVESSYLCTTTECQCPAGVRLMCRHREMLPKFIARNFVNTGFMFDYDRGGWVDMRTFDEMPPLPEGITMMNLDDVGAVHNAIADAIGEPEAKLKPHGAMVSTSDFESEDTGSNPVGVANLAPVEDRGTPYEPEALPNSDVASSTGARPYRKPNDGRRV